MGRQLTFEEHSQVLIWGQNFDSLGDFLVESPIGRCLRTNARFELDQYWNLANLSRANHRRPGLASAAYKVVFNVRVTMERELMKRVRCAINDEAVNVADLFDGNFFGCSIKQGVSLRMPLASCVPTKDCQGACYAHDGMDAGRNPVIKGILNGLVADMFERGSEIERAKIVNLLLPQVRTAIRKASVDALHAGFQRRPRIRFSHVGEVAAFPNFANKLARMVRDESNGDVDCVIYTRHPNAKLLDPDLFLVLFSLDESSEDRRRFIPSTAKIVRSAFGGNISETVDVNFLEHHRWSHLEPVGSGRICPATAPFTEVRTCDACKCDFCFTPKLITLEMRSQ